jgi:hypothetical protein
VGIIVTKRSDRKHFDNLHLSALGYFENQIGILYKSEK